MNTTSTEESTSANQSETVRMRIGIAGRIAAAFINSKLTPLIIIASLMLGVMAVMKTPREEEPQIIVPMMDVMVAMRGATSKEVEQRVTTPMEKLLWEIPGVEYIYSTSSPGQSLAIVRRRREFALLHALGVTAREQIAS